MLKRPKRRFVVVVLVFLDGVESWAKNVPNGTKSVCEKKWNKLNKNVPNGTKNVQGNKKCSYKLK